MRHRLCTLFHHFPFLPPLFVLTLTALYILKFPNEFFVFSRARVRQPLRRGHKIYEFRFGAVLYSAELDAGQGFFPYPFVNALRAVADKFRRRFTYLEEHTIRQGRSLKEMTLSEMDAIWDKAKEEGL